MGTAPPHSWGERWGISAVADSGEEAEFITNEIYQRCVTEGRKHDDFAVLFRMNAQSRLIETHLRQLKIP